MMNYTKIKDESESIFEQWNNPTALSIISVSYFLMNALFVSIVFFTEHKYSYLMADLSPTRNLWALLLFTSFLLPLLVGLYQNKRFNKVSIIKVVGVLLIPFFAVISLSKMRDGNYFNDALLIIVMILLLITVHSTFRLSRKQTQVENDFINGRYIHLSNLINSCDRHENEIINEFGLDILVELKMLKAEFCNATKRNSPIFKAKGLISQARKSCKEKQKVIAVKLRTTEPKRVTLNIDGKRITLSLENAQKLSVELDRVLIEADEIELDTVLTFD